MNENKANHLLQYLRVFSKRTFDRCRVDAMITVLAGKPAFDHRGGPMEKSPTVTDGLNSVKEIAASLEVQPATVYRWTYLKHPLPVRRSGRRILIAIDDLIDFLNTRMPKSPTPTPETEVEKERPTSNQAVSAPSQATAVASKLIPQPTSGSGERELGQFRSGDAPRIAVLTSFQLVEWIG
jgi:hypothetical protein